ncbi:hypothetical protein C7974DRAFT_416843 [Boeremia exigua]|uniref:uncharacterized protein n=1 Tax=Boeremia exigua TaxID=749465 RepID=UPI001E8DC26F|nr:uncharacterized protein C7974DRAFT_416843 [Boeremia exigua]KAH6616727.1 hypothetical protein C7974DRAFT_416843 [Boeremia exigua]
MAQASAGAVALARARIVRESTGNYLVIALPLPSALLEVTQPFSSSETHSAATDMPTQDRDFWETFAKHPTFQINTLLCSLGIRQTKIGPGPLKFQHHALNELADAVTAASRSLPIDMEQLLDAAADYKYAPLQQAIAQLLHQFGAEIWGASKQRSWLLKASEGHTGYQKDLIFEDDAAKVVLMYHLRMWILAKAFNWKRYSARKASNVSENARAKSHNLRKGSNSSLPPRRGQTDTRRETIVAPPPPVVSAATTLSEAPKQQSDFFGRNQSQVRTKLLTSEPQDAGSFDQSQGVTPEYNDRNSESGVTCESSEVTEAITTAYSESVAHPTKPEPGETDSKHDTKRDNMTDRTMLLTPIQLPVDRYWSRDDWRLYHMQGDERKAILATMRSVGLAVIPQHDNRFEFPVRNFGSLGHDINKIAYGLSSKFSAAQLLRYAEDIFSLDEEIDVLFETHAPIWGLDADRTKLIVPGTDENYPKDLIYEESADQKLLWMHLHRWIFLIAFKNRQQMHNTDATNTDPGFQLEGEEITGDTPGEFQRDRVHTFDVSEEHPGPASRHGLDDLAVDDAITKPNHTGSVSVDPALGEYEQGKLGELGHNLAEVNDQDSSTLLGDKAEVSPKKPSRYQHKRKDDSSAETEQHEILRPLKQHRTYQSYTNTKGHELGALFTSYLCNYHDLAFDEVVALKHLKHGLSLLDDDAISSPTQRSIELATAFLVLSFPAWLEYRREVVSVKRSYAAMQPPQNSPQQHRHLALLERSRLVTQLRQAHERLLEAGYDGLRPEQVIFQTMKMFLNVQNDSQMAQDIRDGFLSLEAELMKLGDQLMKDGGAKWVMGGSSSVSSLEGLRSQERDG